MAAPIQNPAKCEGVRLLHDNARPHTALVTKALLKQFKWEVLDHPPYSPDLVPSDFHLFLYLKSHLGGTSFQDEEEIKDEVEMWFRQQAAAFYDCGIQKLVPRLNKCLDNGGMRAIVSLLFEMPSYYYQGNPQNS